uniref:G-protein coupled receptors family 1 profile domain-containing protein n=1 Tax=Callorhinchus milii TaxID=7868 RepID=A0A4W3J4S1_CALMI
MTMMSTEMADYSDEYNTSYDYPEDSGICNKDSINNFAKTFMPAFYVLLLLFSLLGNGLVLCVLVKYEYLRSITNIFILNLAVSDLLSAFCLPFWTMHHLTGWIFGDIMCKVVGVFFVGYYNGIMFLTLMTADRYFAVVHAVYAARSRKTCYAVTASLVVWAISLSASVEHIWLLFGYYQQIILFFLIPLVVIVYCCYKIMNTVLRCKARKKYKAVKVILCIVIFFLCWAPYNMVIFLVSLKQLDVSLFTTCETSKHIDYAYFISRNVAYFHCCLNPVFYAFVHTKLKMYLAQCLGKCIKFIERQQDRGSPDWLPSAPSHLKC